jgi:hypothetical protein
LDGFEEALRNIDVFCKVLVNKMLNDPAESGNNITVEPMEKLLLRKYIVDEQSEPRPLAGSLIPLPLAEEPLIDIFEDDNYVKILMQCCYKDQKVTVHTGTNDIEICKKECYTNEDGAEVCSDRCQKLDVPTKYLQIEDMTTKCSNNAVLEINIPKKV